MRLSSVFNVPAFLLIASAAHAACVGMPAFQTCNDAAGNSYTVNRLGNTTMMQGSSALTGSQWSQQSTTFGNTTMHNGVTNGQPWHMQEQTFGGMTTYSGVNAAGEAFYHTCNQFGCW